MEGGEPGNAGHAVRHQGYGYVRPWIWWAWYAGTLGIGLLAASSGFAWWLVGAIVVVGGIEWGRRTTIHEITLAGERLVLRTDAGRRIDLGVGDLAGFRTSRWSGDRLLTTDGRRFKVRVSGGLVALLDRLLALRPDLDIDEVRVRSAKSEKGERRLAARRARHPWMTRLTIVLTVIGLGLALGSVALAVAERNQVVARAVIVEATVLSVDGNDDEVLATIGYLDPDGVGHEAVIATAEVTREATEQEARTIMVAVDPQHPETVWARDRGPGVVHQATLPLLLAGGVLLTAAVLMAPTAFAEPPDLEEVDPDDL